MRIAIVAPPYLSVPPVGYGGTEKIVSYLADGLVEQGEDVTLFASGDSKTKAKLKSIFPKSLGINALTNTSDLLPLLYYKEAFGQAEEFDIVHSHAEYLGLFSSERLKTPIVHTWHGTLYEGELPEEKRTVLKSFKDSNFISISNNQREGIPDLNFVETVYNSIDLKEYKFVENPNGSYLLWVGRMTEAKGPLDAIRVAKELNMPLVLAGTIDAIDKTYYEEIIKPELNTNLIKFIGELMDPKELQELYANAFCTLFPISWHEPFGLVMIESMACGTPVVAYNIGSVPEIINGKTGYIVDFHRGVEGLKEAVLKIKEIKRSDCRIHVEENFSIGRMASGYKAVYEKIVNGKL